MPELSRYDPTAMQDPEGHDTPASVGFVPLGLGVGCTVQLDPFQTSARVDPPEVSADPTAVQLLAEAHVTPHNLPLTAVGWTDHWAPFHDSMSPPTAVQEVAVGHDTLLRLLSWLGLGESSVVQVKATRSSARLDRPVAPPEYPTPVQRDGDTHETPSRKFANPCPSWGD